MGFPTEIFMTTEKAIDCLHADKEYLTDMNVCDGEEMDVAIKAIKTVNKIREITDSATPDMNNDDIAKLFFQIQEKLGVC